MKGISSLPCFKFFHLKPRFFFFKSFRPILVLRMCEFVLYRALVNVILSLLSLWVPCKSIITCRVLLLCVCDLK